MFRFLGIGAQKAGTSWLYQMLLHHGAISFPLGKEVHLWSRAGGLKRSEVQAYLQGFSAAGRVEGEMTPVYGTLDAGRVRLIHQWAPHLRLFFVMRNPVDRAWSAALMALKRAELEFGEVSQQWFIDHFHSRGSLARGDYLHTIKTWRDIFGANALLLLRYENISLAPRTLLSQVAAHLEVSPDELIALPDDVLGQRVFQGGVQPLPDALREVLEVIYRPRIQALEDFLDESTGW